MTEGTDHTWTDADMAELSRALSTAAHSVSGAEEARALRKVSRAIDALILRRRPRLPGFRDMSTRQPKAMDDD